ncbi:host cell division inhibitory peptide Kil [Sodalis ligni]|nr:host cell division inhibitory peptide Kil [Sodalis ligni]
MKGKAAMAAAARNKAVIARFLGDEKMWREALVKLGQAMRRVQ